MHVTAHIVINDIFVEKTDSICKNFGKSKEW